MLDNRVGQQLGNYHIVRMLGQGGQALVYLGEHHYLRSQAALKMLQTSLEDEHVERFLAEAQTLARLTHPSIVRVLDYTVEDGNPVLIMDYAPRGTLRQRYPPGTHLPLPKVVSYISQVAAALQYAHSCNVMHRDVKPENLLLGSVGQILLSDFGLALFTPSPELLGTQKMAGTTPYMAPEQLQGHPCFASDQYALGIVTYEWLCGRRPFTGSHWHLIQQHLYTAPPSLREHAPSVPKAMEAVVMRTLAKDPRERFASVQGFAHALVRASEEHLHTESVDMQATVPMALRSPSATTLRTEPSVAQSLTSSPRVALLQRVALVAASADADVADRLHTDLETRGISVWYNRSGHSVVDPVQRQERGRQAIRADCLVLMVLSPYTRTSSTIAASMQLANQERRRMAFIWIDGEEAAPLLPIPRTWGPTAVIDVLDARKEQYEQALETIMTYLHEEEVTSLPSALQTDQPSALSSPFSAASFVPPAYTQNVPTRVPSSEPVARTAQPISSTEDVNRQRLLAKVKAFWISGVLEQSLHGEALIALGLHERFDAVANPWHLVIKPPDAPAQALPAGTPIAQVYDEALGELLILGEPGAGKTTLLLELARTQLERASQDARHPMPVVFNLSSWVGKRQTLAQWLIDELNSKYQVPRQLGTTWVETDQILPLLDGLDEVALEARASCMEAINVYRLQHGLAPMVVCSRSNEYLSQPVHLLLRKAVVVQPLTPRQIEMYLADGGKQLVALRKALREDADLRILASIPLMLNVLTLAYRGTPRQEIAPAGSSEMKQEQVFASYVQRMLAHRGTSADYTPEQIVHWLSRLAQQLKQQSQSIFYLERMQPNWLSGNWMPRAYDWLTVYLPDVLIGILVSLTIQILFFSLPDPSTFVEWILLGGLLGGIFSRGNAAQRPTEGEDQTKRVSWSRLLGPGVLVGLGIGLIHGLQRGQANDPTHRLRYGLSHFPTSGPIHGLTYGLIFGLCGILLSVLLMEGSITESLSQVWGTIWQRPIRSKAGRNVLLVGLLLGLSYGLSRALTYGLSYGLSRGLIYGLIYGLVGGLLSLLLTGRSTGIQLTDRLTWVWSGLFTKRRMSVVLRLTALIGLLWGLGVGLTYGPTYGLIYGLVIGLSLGPSIGLTYGLLLGFFRGVSSETIEDQQRVVPNQGIRRSALNGLVLGITSSIFLGLSGFVSYELLAGLSTTLHLVPSIGLGTALSNGLLVGLCYGLSAGLLAGLLNGGLACLRHWILRLLLWRTGSIPWNYPHFLDVAAERILLRKVGGGYLFIHRLLLEYFATLDTTRTSHS